MKLKLIFIIAILGLITLLCHAQFRSITHTTTGTNDLSISIETNTRYIIHSMAVAFTNLATGTVTLAHTRASHTVPLEPISVSNVLGDVVYYNAYYLVDGNQGDVLTLSTTNVGKPSKVFLTIQY